MKKNTQLSISILKMLRLAQFSFLLFILTTFNIKAQVSAYTFASAAGTYTAITSGTVANAVGSSWDDAVTSAIPIGFNFYFNGTTYSTFGINSNGFIILGSGAPVTGYCPANIGTSNSNVIMAYGTDLVPVSASLGEIQYLTQGSGSSHTLTVQWKNVHHFLGAAGDNWTFQIILTESTNTVKIVYGPMTETTSGAANACADAANESGGVGLIGATNADFNARKVAAANTWAASVAAPNVTANASVCFLRAAILPASGLTWTWTPPAVLSATTLTAFGANCINNTIGPNSFTITGNNLSAANVTVGASSGYTYSTTSGGSYTSTLSITHAAGAFSQQVFVKFTSTAVTTYNTNIAIGGGGATTVNVAPSGSGINTPVLVVANTAIGVTSSLATLPGTYTTGCNAVTAYGIEYSATSGFVNGTGTFVTSSNQVGGAFSISLTGLAANQTYYYKAVATDGTGTVYSTQNSFSTLSLNPTLTASSLASFGNICSGLTSGANTFTITGDNLTNANVTLDPLTDFTYSTDNINYFTSLSLAQSGGTYSQLIYVKFTPSSASAYSGNIVLGGAGAPSINVGVAGTGLTLPSIPTATNPGVICSGTPVNITASSAGNTINWYNSALGGTLLTSTASGANYSVSPLATTSYYAQSQIAATAPAPFTYTGSVQSYTIPNGVTSITINAKGASGGYVSGATAGHGASMTGTFSVTPGQTLWILAGQSPGLTTSFPAGGGGSFVGVGASLATATPLIAAGGGGAAYSTSTGTNAPITTSGTGTSPGTAGNGAPAGSCSGGGGGFYTSGGTDALYGFTGGAGFRQGGAGGIPTSLYTSSYQAGGFGGGAPANYVGSCNQQAGNGGGYSGGSAFSTTLNTVGNAGGSFNGGTNQTNLAGNNNGNGVVTITFPPVLGCASSSRTQVTVSVNDPLAPSVVGASTVCGTGSVVLSASGSGGTLNWYNVSSGGSIINTGSTYTSCIDDTSSR